MKSTPPSRFVGKAFAVIALAGLCSLPLLAQGPAPAGNASVESAPAILATATKTERVHRFFDKWNVALFAGSAGLNATDFAATRANLQSGGRELNPVVRVFGRSTAGLAFNFGGETAGTIGLSYFLHKTGHHRLERLAPMINIGTSAGAVSDSLLHR